MTDDSERPREMPTELAPPPSEPCRDTMPPGPDNEEAERVMRTMLPAGLPSGALVDVSDSVIGRLIAEIAEAARVMLAERDARVAQAAASAQNQKTLIEQQGEIIKILQRTEQTTEANHAIQLAAIKRLQDSDRDQDGKIGAMQEAIERLKEEQLAAADRALEAAGQIAQLDAELRALKQARSDGQRPAAAEAAKPT